MSIQKIKQKIGRPSKQKTPTTKGKRVVNFMVNGSDLYAYFPDNIVTKDTFECYSDGHFESCHKDYFNSSRNATKDEYKSLQSELEGLGYSLVVKEGHKNIAPNLKQVMIFI